MDQNVLYRGQRLTLTRFWATGEPCLWITDPEQIGMPKMEFVGGHPDEYCIFLKNLTETELAQITSLDGAPLDVKKELSQPRIKNDGLCFDISDKIVVDVNVAFFVIVHGIAFADLNFLNQAHQRGTV